MMSKKQLACMLTLHIIYLLLGASIFYHIESPVEMAQRAEEKLERLEIQNLLYENYIPTDPDKQDSILKKLSEYCGKSMFNYTTEDEEPPIKWDFYHSFFFSYTVVSTIGYGNLAPTTHLSRILMIFYGLFGIPINGILLANLGEYFGLQLITVYRRYKKRDGRRADVLDYFFHNLGMLGQIFLYLVPGFLFFIFLPACIFVVFEGWDFVAAIYYAFVTLTTIGFGDLVAGTVNNGFAQAYFSIYQIFLVVWITFGLGYIVMLLGFITSGMRSESVHKIEQKIASQWKSTQNRILTGFTRDMNVIRKLINEANLIKLKPVYVDQAPYLIRSKSCPILTFDVEPRGPIYRRKRANSENIYLSARDMLRIQSDTDLLGIDKERTFSASAMVKPAELLARVVNVLGGLDQSSDERGVHMFDDDEILASEKTPNWTIGQETIVANQRTRALSVAVPNYRKESVTKIDHDLTWTNGESAEKYREAVNKRAGKMSLPAITPPIISSEQNPPEPKNLLAKLFQRQRSEENPDDSLKDRDSVTQDQNETANIKPKPRRGSIFSRFMMSDKDDNTATAYKEKTKRGRGSIFPTFNKEEDEDEKQAKAYREKTKRGRHSIFPTFDFNMDDDDEEEKQAKAYREKTKKGRHSIFPTFDFSEEDNEEEHEAAAKAYLKKSSAKRHSIFPTFNFDEEEDDSSAKAYREKTRSGRKSIFPTFDFSESEEDNMAKKYKDATKRGRRSIFPTFDFSSQPKEEEEDDTVDEEEVRKYQSRTQRGRLSLFPTFGKNKKKSTDDDEPVNEMSEELKSYQNKTKKGRGSLFPSFGKDRKSSTSEEPSDMEADIKKYQSQTNRGRGSLFANDIQNFRSAHGRRPSLLDMDVSELPDEDQVEVLEQTSVADLLRVLAALDHSAPQGKRGSIDSPLLNILAAAGGAGEPSPGPPQTRRRGSVHPDYAMPVIPQKTETEESSTRRRRVSARAATPQFTPTLATVVAGAELQTTAKAARENRMSKVLPQAAVTEEGGGDQQQPRVRRFSPAPVSGGRSSTTAPVSRLFSRIRKESVSSIEEEEARRDSLTDIVIDKNKDNT